MFLYLMTVIDALCMVSVQTLPLSGGPCVRSSCGSSSPSVGPATREVHSSASCYQAPDAQPSCQLSVTGIKPDCPSRCPIDPKKTHLTLICQSEIIVPSTSDHFWSSSSVPNLPFPYILYWYEGQITNIRTCQTEKWNASVLSYMYFWFYYFG